MTNLTLEVAKELLEYDQHTGKIYWKSTGVEAGYIHSNGYRYIGVGGRGYRAHRIAYLLCVGAHPEGEIDHIDGNRQNNSFENLRQCSRAENARNAGIRHDNSMSIKGIDISQGRFRAQLAHNKKRYSRRFQLLEEAQEWLEFVREELHGSFSNHGNFGGAK